MPAYSDYLPTLRIQRVFAISPDQAKVAYIDDAYGQFGVAIRRLSGGSVHRVHFPQKKTVRHVAWHPSAESLIILADSGGNEKTQVYLVPVDSGEPTALTDAPDAQYAAALGNPVSPDGRVLMYAGNDRDPGDQDVLTRDLTTGEVRRIYQGGGRVSAGFWSPDGSRLSVLEFRDGQSDHIVYLAARDGAEPARRLTPLDEPATYWLGPWLADGSGFIVRSNVGREFTGLALLHTDTCDLTWLDAPEWDVEAVALSSDGRLLVWSVNVDGLSQLRGRDLVTGNDLAIPDLPAGVIFDLAVAANNASVIACVSTATTPINLVVADLSRHEAHWLTDAKPVAVEPKALVEPTMVRYPARDGREVPAYLYRPTVVDRPVGVVLSIHGGPDHQERPTYMYDGLYQYLLSQGVAVLVPNYRGSTGYGMSNVRLIHRDWGGGDLSDLAGAADYLQQQAWVDSARIGLFGASYGGFAVLSCLSRLPEVGWAAAVDWIGPSNLVTLAKQAPPTWRARVLTMIGDPDADKEFLLSRSPVTYADQIHAPLFVIQGANDPRVPQSESDQMVERLRSRGVEVRYEVYPDEGHGFVRRDNQVNALSDAAEFLLSHLRPGH